MMTTAIERFGPVMVLEETPEPTSLLFRRRLKKLGAVEVAGQLAFGVLQRALRFASRHRLAEIIATHRLVPTPAADHRDPSRLGQHRYLPSRVGAPCSGRRPRHRHADHWP